MDLWRDMEGFSRSLLLVLGELALLVLVFVLVAGFVRFVFGRLGSIPVLQKYLGQAERVRNRIRGLLILLCILAGLFLLGCNGYLLYRQVDVYQQTLALLKKIPSAFWGRLLIRLGKTAGLAVGAHFVGKYLLILLAKVEARAKAYEHVKSNDESIEEFFLKLCRLLKNSLRFLVAAYAVHAVSATVDQIFLVGFKLYLIIAVGYLVVKAADALIDSLDALSKKYWYRERYLDWYTRLSRLMPLFRRCLDYVIYVWGGSLVMLQVEFMAHFAFIGTSLVQIIGLFFIARVAIEVANLLVDKFLLANGHTPENPNQRLKTLVPIIKTLLQYGIYFICFIFMLWALNIDPLPLLAGAGILGVAVGMGAQSLINDLVSGFFVIFEGTFLVGDYIEMASVRGIVEGIHIRTTQVRDPDGQLHIVRNGQINSVVNYSKDYTFAVVEVGVAYDSDLDHVFRVLEETSLKLQERNPDVLEPLKVQGLKKFGESELLVRTVTKVRPGRHLQVGFELRTLIKKAFDLEGIEIPFARRVVIFKNPAALDKSKVEKRVDAKCTD
jgi:small conductance mechanosensitive channel